MLIRQLGEGVYKMMMEKHQRYLQTRRVRACPSRLWLVARIAVLAGIVGVSSVPSLHGQWTGLSGIVTDQTGGVVPGAEIKVTNEEIGLQRSTLSDVAGRYAFAQLRPGTYTLVATKEGFESVTLEGVVLLVNTTVTNNIVFGTVEAVQETVNVFASVVQVNTTDASIGTAFGTKPIRQLPLNARNPAGLLSLQAGVTFLSADPLDSQKAGDIRNGSVNGAQSDQSNVTLDGVDVNDQNGQLPFTSVLRNTLDSIQEFRVVTTAANADQGRSAGAQVSLVTKSGTNEIHGSLYEYHRNTTTAANDFFNNSAGVERAKLIRNVFGASVGGPIKRDRVFYFANYEGRRDASEGSAVRTVPNNSMRNGFLRYRDVNGAVQELDPAFIRSNIDPLQIGSNPATLEYFRSFPEPNDSTAGDGLNTAGYRFTAPTPLVWNTLITKVDWTADQNGAHHMFLRGNFQNDSISGVPQFPGEPPNRETRDTSRGLAFGYTGVLDSSSVATFRYGFTAQKVNLTGVQKEARVSLGDSLIDNSAGTTTPQETYLPTQTVSGDISVIRGPHSLQFGGVFRSIRNQRFSFGNSYHFAKQAAWAIPIQNWETLESRLPAAPADSGNFQENMATTLGVINFIQANYNFDLDGNPLPAEDPTRRTYGKEELELYFQDTWRVKPGLSITAGLRWSLIPPVREVNGLQVSITPRIGDYIALRQELAEAGRPTREAGPIGYVAADSAEGKPLWDTSFTNFSPRLAVAFSPQARNGFLAKLFGGPGKTSIRAGAGLFYNNFGMGMIQMLDRNAFGLSTSLTQTTFTLDTAPRFSGFSDLPAAGLPPPPGGGPGTPPNSGAWSQGIDSSVQAPYSINPTIFVSRELGGGFIAEVGYVGRLGRKLLTNDTAAAQYANFKDPESGQYLIDALSDFEMQISDGRPVSAIGPVAFWENLYSNAATQEMTATQRVYEAIRSTSPDTGTAIANLDGLWGCNPFCSDFGPGAFMNPQFWAFDALRSFGTSTYHSMQLSLRKAFSSGFQFDLNYTLSKSKDLVSVGERPGVGVRFGQQPSDTYWSTHTVINSWNREGQRADSDFDMRHQANANWVVELPFGQGKPILPNMGPAGQAVLGDWQVSGLLRLTSGLPLSVTNGLAWPTCYCYRHFAEVAGPIPEQTNTTNARLIGGGTGPNVFSDPQAALSSFRQVLPGEVGQRNNLRGHGIFSIDMAIGKRFQMPFEGHSLQFRAEAFNLTNSVRFNTAVLGTLDLSTGSGSFGNYSLLMIPPRVMQFGLRYEF